MIFFTDMYQIMVEIAEQHISIAEHIFKDVSMHNMFLVLFVEGAQNCGVSNIERNAALLKRHSQYA